MFHVPVGFKTCSHYCHIATGRVKRPRVAQEGLSSRQPWPPCEVVAPHAGELECRPATCASAPLSPGTGVRAVSESGFSKERLICVGAGRPIRWLPTRAGRSPSKRPKIQDPVFLFSIRPVVSSSHLHHHPLQGMFLRHISHLPCEAQLTLQDALQTTCALRKGPGWPSPALGPWSALPHCAHGTRPRKRVHVWGSLLRPASNCPSWRQGA